MQCLVNDATTLRSPRIAEAFANANVAYLKAMLEQQTQHERQLVQVQAKLIF
jgi:hypothetical protein